MVVAKPQLAFLFAAAAFAVEQPLLLCSPGGRDGFGSQYFHHMAVFGACAAHGDCCYVHSSFQTLAHGADPRRAEAFTGLRSGDACRHLLSSPRRDETLPPDPEGASIGCSNGRLRREGATAGWRFEGRPEDFGPALATHPRVHWRLGGDPLHTFHELVTAPTLFVAAKSTFSAAAAVLNEGELLYAPLKAYAVHQAKQEHTTPRGLLRPRLRLRTKGYREPPSRRRAAVAAPQGGPRRNAYLASPSGPSPQQ
ncbi:histone methylation protein DOT1 [Aureococcus anophagefferens]|nr:histone methylation protein DOT1 [Aureococcus anophagefferens]